MTTAASPGILVDAVEAAELLGISRAHFLKQVSNGEAPRGVKVGRSRRWSTDELSAWVYSDCPSREQWEELRRRLGFGGQPRKKL